MTVARTSSPASATTLLLGIVTVKVLAHFAIDLSGRYGYFRDELYYIACSRHLALGYVDHPPFSIFLLAIERRLLGESLLGIRFLPVIVGAAVVLLTAVMVRQLGGRRFAQGLAALAVLLAPVMLIQDLWYSMNSYDILFWTLASYLVIRILKEPTPQKWLALGVVIGLGLMNKYSIGFLCIGLAGGLLITRERRLLRSRWPWLAAGLAVLIFLPHVLWEWQHGFPTIEFMRNAEETKNIQMTPWHFLLSQFDETGRAAAVLWVLGLVYCLLHRDAKLYRLFGWMYLVIFAFMVTRNAKAYYLTPIYPLLWAFGAVGLEKFAERRGRRWLAPVAVGLLVLSGMISLPFALPVLPVDTFIAYQRMLGATPPQEERQEMGALPQYYADMFGWPAMVGAIAAAYDSLTPSEQSSCAILMNNYGEAGAVDFFGRDRNLPKAISGHNNYWLWGPRGLTGEVVIRLGGDVEKMRANYAEVRQVGVFHDDYCMPYENQPVFVLKRRHASLAQDWPSFKHYE
jgi:hypothetical protein